MSMLVMSCQWLELLVGVVHIKFISYPLIDSGGWNRGGYTDTAEVMRYVGTRKGSLPASLSLPYAFGGRTQKFFERNI
jgi:hypothetical protein